MKLMYWKRPLLAAMAVLVLFTISCSNMMDDKKDHDSPVLDFEPPAVTEFTLTSKDYTSISTVAFSLDGTDDIGITAWAITESVTPPDADDGAWLDEKPASYALQDVSEGNHTLYAWAMDGAGNISAAVDCIIVDLASPSAELVDLDLSLDGLDPGFSSGTLAYTLITSLDSQNVTVAPEAADPDATITVNGTACVSGEDADPLTLNLGENDITILVRSSEGIEQTYTVEVVRGMRQAYIKASNTGANDSFGLSLSLYEDTLAVGAYKESSAATGINGDETDNSSVSSGAVYIFVRSGKTWVQQAYIKASNTGGRDFFGYSVSLYGDTLAVGAQGEDSAATGINGTQTDNNADGAGAVYVFTRSGTTWSQQAYVKASNTGAGVLFGRVSLYGNTLAVGAQGEKSTATGINGNQSNNSADGAGAVYVFTRSGTTWSQQAYVKASNTGEGDCFGISISLYGDILAVGAIGESSTATGINGNQSNNSAEWAGAVYVFTRSGTTWSQQAYIKASNTETWDSFGRVVSLYGETLAVSSFAEGSSAIGVNGTQTDNSAGGSGAVYVFTRSGTTWSQQAYIKASNTGSGDGFGGAVVLYGDTLGVGAPEEDSAATGINGDQSDNSTAGSGAVYVFTRSGASWSQSAYVKESNTDAGDNFGWSLALYGDALVVGAGSEDSAATGVNGDQSDNSAAGSGAVYVYYDLIDNLW